MNSGIDAAFATLVKERADAFLVSPDALVTLAARSVSGKRRRAGA